MEGLPLNQLTHGDGDGRGDGVDDDGVETADDGVETASLPSLAPTNASAMPGDLDDFDDTEEIILEPTWIGSQSQTCSDGSWATAETRGGGEAEAEQVKESDHGGNFWLLTANWGGNWQEAKLQEHMLRDLKSTPCHLLCLQEAEEDMIIHLRRAVEGDASAVAERRPGSKFIGVRGPEPKGSLMICARQSVVPGIRLITGVP